MTRLTIFADMESSMTRASRERNLIRKHELATSVSPFRDPLFSLQSPYWFLSALANVFEKNEKKNKTTSVYGLKGSPLWQVRPGNTISYESTNLLHHIPNPAYLLQGVGDMMSKDLKGYHPSHSQSCSR